MTTSRVPSFLGISLLLLSLTKYSVQQNSTTNSTTNSQACDSFGFTSEPVNATGQVSFSGVTPSGVANNTWILSESLSDRRDTASGQTNQFETVYLSTPVAQNFSDPTTGVQGCMYMLGNLNKTSSTGNSGGDQSCNGIISQTCQDAITYAGRATAITNQGKGEIDNTVCASILSLLSACHSEGGISGSRSAGFNFTGSTTCDIDRDPYGINIPDGYRSAALFGSGSVPSDSINSYTVYDSKIKQTGVYAVSVWGTAAGSSFADSRVLCIRTENITAGSRSPSANAGVRNGVGNMGVFALAAGAFFLL